MNCGLQILKTYFSRPIYWLAYVPIIGICLTMGVNATTWDGPLSVAPVLTAPKPILLANSQNFFQKRDEPSAITCRTLDFQTVEPDTVPDLTSFPQLTTLRILTQTLSEQDLQRILAAPKLKSLRLEASELADGTLARLGSKLVELEISSRLLKKHPKDLPQMSRLQTMILELPDAPTAEMFQAISSIPNLRTLSIVQYPAITSIRGFAFPEELDTHEVVLTKEMIQPLLGHPTLIAVFANWPHPFLERPSLLRELHAFPASISRWIKKSLPLASMAMIMLLLIFSNHQEKLLSLPQSSLAPEFDFWNRLVLDLLLIVMTLVMAFLFALNGVNFLSAVAIILSAPAIMALWLVIASHSSFLVQRFTLLLFVGVLFSSFQLQQSILPSHLSGELSWFLLGYRTAWASIVILLEVGVLAWAICNLSSKTVIQIRESYAIPVSLFFGNRTSSEKTGTVGDLDGVNSQRIPILDNRQWPKRKFIQAQRLVRRTISDHCYSVWAIVILVPVMMGLTPILTFQEPFRWQRFREFKTPLALLAVGTIYGVIAAYVFSSFHWEKRKKGMELEFCYPSRRVDIAKQLWCGTGLDLIPMSFCLVIGLIVITPFQDRSALSLTLAIVTGFSLTSLFHGSMVSLLAFPSNVPWACTTFLAFVMTILACTSFRIATELDFTGRLLVACGVLTTSIMLNSWVYGKLRDREWGDLAE